MEMDRSSPTKRKLEAQPGGEGTIIKRQNVSMGMETLDCPICYEPLKPPIHQCSVGHFICSSCLPRISNGKCYLCCAKQTSFERCFGMEHVVESVIVPCCNAKHGCVEGITYYNKAGHEKACPNTPVFCPHAGCSFVAAPARLAGHFIIKHQLPLIIFNYHKPMSLHIKPGVHVLRCPKDDNLFLLNLVAEPFGHALSVFWVQPNVTEPKIVCEMYYEFPPARYVQRSSCSIRCTSLSEGVPLGYNFIVPKDKVYDGGPTILLIVTIEKCGA